MYDPAKTIIDEIKRKFISDPVIQDSNNDITKIIFKNYRKNAKRCSGMRLSRTGLSYVKSCFDSYEIPLSEDILSMKDILYIERKLKLPYYLDAKRIVVFEKKFAVLLKLQDGRIRQMTSGDLNF